jgi:hypothetical protein
MVWVIINNEAWIVVKDGLGYHPWLKEKMVLIPDVRTTGRFAHSLCRRCCKILIDETFWKNTGVATIWNTTAPQRYERAVGKRTGWRGSFHDPDPPRSRSTLPALAGELAMVSRLTSTNPRCICHLCQS